MALTDSQWAAAAADIFARLAAATITEAEAASELATATADWPTRSLSNAGLAEQLSRFKARVNGLILTDGPPADDLGGVNAIAIDLTARVFYGPKVVSDAWPDGEPFAEGPPGPPGDTGPAGAKGDAGDTGPKGDKGDEGDPGPAGPKGDPGDEGPKGDTGDNGPAGPKGDKGDTGDQGPPGAAGSGSGDMIAANALSEVDPEDARTNLSVYSMAESDTALGGKADLVGGKVPTAQLPALAITDVFEVATQAAMLALTAERGDVAIRTDENKSYVLAAEPATTLANWKLLRTPTDVVLSVAGETGAITAAALKAALAYAIADIPGLQVALDAKLAKSGGEMTGAVRLKGFSEKAGTYTTGALDASTGSLFDAAISANVTVSLSNLPASPVTGETVTAVLRATVSGTPVITWPSGLIWAGATGPTLAAGYWEFAISARWTGSAWAYTGAWAKFF